MLNPVAPVLSVCFCSCCRGMSLMIYLIGRRGLCMCSLARVDMCATDVQHVALLLPHLRSLRVLR